MMQVSDLHSTLERLAPDPTPVSTASVPAPYLPLQQPPGWFDWIDWTSIGIGVLSNILTIFVVALAGFIFYRIFSLGRRHRLLRFFGITNEHPHIRAYVSRVVIKPGGSTGAEENIKVGYTGPAITKFDYDAALLLCGKLQSNVLALLPSPIQHWLGQRNVTLQNVDMPVDVSPDGFVPSDYGNLILIGSSVYNWATKYYLNLAPSRYYFVKRSDGERVIMSRENLTMVIEMPGRPDYEPAIIERMHDSYGNTIFICAGVDATATFASARYLAENWYSLWREFGDKDFYVYLLLTDQQRNSMPVGRPIRHAGGLL